MAPVSEAYCRRCRHPRVMRTPTGFAIILRPSIRNGWSWSALWRLTGELTRYAVSSFSAGLVPNDVKTASPLFPYASGTFTPMSGVSRLVGEHQVVLLSMAANFAPMSGAAA